MKQKGYNRIRLADGQLIAGPIAVLFDDSGNYVSHHRLTAEEAATEWVGGTFEIKIQ